MWIHLLTLGLIDGAGGTQVAPPPGGGGEWSTPRKKKLWQVQVGAKVYTFETAEEARAFLSEPELEPEIRRSKAKKANKAEPVIAPLLAKARIVDRPQAAPAEIALVKAQVQAWNAAIVAAALLAMEQDDEHALLMLM